MIILHCIQEEIYLRQLPSGWIGEHLFEKENFIHCSLPSQFSYVAPRFKDTKDNLIFLALDTEKLIHPLKWEGKEKIGMDYPHIYGMINTDAIITTYPYLRDNDGNWRLNPELISK